MITKISLWLFGRIPKSKKAKAKLLIKKEQPLFKKRKIIPISAIIIMCFLYSCMPIHKTAYAKDDTHSAHLTTQPDTCKKSKLVYVYWHYKGQYKKQLESNYRDSVRNEKTLRKMRKE